MEITRIFDILDRYKNKFDKSDALGGKKDGVWETYSVDDYINYSNKVSYGLLELGIQKGDKIATISNNRPEWNFVDMGLSQIGAIHVPIYPTISNEETEFILDHCDARLVIVSDKSLFEKVKPIFDKNEKLEKLYTFNEVEGAINWTEILNLGEQNEDKFKDKLPDIKKSISKDDLVTLIYTSGTTGMPKGVMLSHWNIVTNVVATSVAHPLGHEHRALSFLPLCHIYERMMCYHLQYKGISIYYAENMGKISDNLKEIKPHIFNTVPRLLEKVYDKIIGKGKNLPYVSKVIFFWAVRLGNRYRLENRYRFFYNLKLKVARKLIFSKWLDALGGNVYAIVSGGAALQPRLERIFWAAGVHLAQGYGLTETSPVIAVNHVDLPNIKFTTVGKIIDKVEAKIAEDGEILCKGPNIMQGYYKNEEATREAIDAEGWFHTGDIGFLDNENYLTITDRKKEIFKLSAGKYVAPQAIENKLKESFFIENAMVVGENEKFASALISPNFSFLHDWCFLHKVQFRDNKELVKIPQVVARYQKEINLINEELGEHEKIKRIRLVCEEWSPQTGELSPTLKLKRRILYDKYNSILEEIYAPTRESNNGGSSVVSKISGLGNAIGLGKKQTQKTK